MAHAFYDVRYPFWPARRRAMRTAAPPATIRPAPRLSSNGAAPAPVKGSSPSPGTVVGGAVVGTTVVSVVVVVSCGRVVDVVDELVDDDEVEELEVDELLVVVSQPAFG
jgi:hypothetical protein